ncbi:hypothetical protein IAR55_002805 [Kwoniella newhampshirensis]|uniref:Peptidase M48 domain-containing protein n=1 Tax=Kwoniella newhampshirensis TaxID=1651941 RepID=A0AAW0Z049_9TREE
MPPTRTAPRTPEAMTSSDNQRPYKLQTHFRLLGKYYGEYEVVRDDHQRRALTDAITLARRLVFSSAGLHITSSAFSIGKGRPRQVNSASNIGVDPSGTVPDSRVMENLRQFQISGHMEVVVNADIECYGCVGKKEPTLIHIRQDLIIALGEAHRSRQVATTAYNAQSLFTAVVIGHEMQHLMRGQGIGKIRRTPPQVNDGLHYKTCKIRDTWSITEGEGGRFWEYYLFGGDFLATIYTEGSAAYLYPVKELLIECNAPPEPYHYTIPSFVVDSIALGTEGWEALLPIRPYPTESVNPGRTTENCLRLSSATLSADTTSSSSFEQSKQLDPISVRTPPEDLLLSPSPTPISPSGEAATLHLHPRCGKDLSEDEDASPEDLGMTQDEWEDWTNSKEFLEDF